MASLVVHQSRICLQFRRLRFDSWVGRSPGGRHGNPLQDSCLENPMDRGAWQTEVHEVAELDTTEVTEHAHMHTDVYTYRERHYGG